MISIDSSLHGSLNFCRDTCPQKKCKGFQKESSVLNCKISKNFLLIFERGA